MHLGCVVHGAQDTRPKPSGRRARPPGRWRSIIAFGGICRSRPALRPPRRRRAAALREPMVCWATRSSGTWPRPEPDTPTPAAGTPVAGPIRRPRLRRLRRSARPGSATTAHAPRYLGSAARFPHVQGSFATRITVPWTRSANSAGPGSAARGSRRATRGGGATRSPARRRRARAPCTWSPVPGRSAAWSRPPRCGTRYHGDHRGRPGRKGARAGAAGRHPTRTLRRRHTSSEFTGRRRPGIGHRRGAADRRGTDPAARSGRPAQATPDQ
ncbi:hypothetical protein HBB16_07620 [Pseudonocardia sp. MCCB 268]|nr:hypothetical protein [Pseudonocardia cytotoxica]